MAMASRGPINKQLQPKSMLIPSSVVSKVTPTIIQLNIRSITTTPNEIYAYSINILETLDYGCKRKG